MLMYLKVKNYFRRTLKNEDGQGMVEYALLVGLIAIVVVAALVLLGPAIKDKFTEIINNLKPTPPPVVVP